MDSSEIGERLSQVLEKNRNFMLAALDGDFKYVFVNEGYADAHQKTIEKLKGQRHFELYPNKMLEQVFRNVAKTKKPFIVEAEPFMLEDEQSNVYWNWEVAPFGEDGIIISIVDVTNEISFKEQEIKHYERYMGIFDRNISGMYLRSLDGVIVDCNDSYAQIMRVSSKDEIIGKNIHDLFAHDQRNFVTMLSDLVNGRLETRETKITFADGEEKWVLENAILIKRDEFKESFIEGIVVDISETKNAAIELNVKQRQILELQSQMLASQMNPHFIFNAVNSINSYIVKEEITSALLYTSDFASLMRKVLENSQNPFIHLGDEIDFLSEYLNLERKRLRGKFDFTIKLLAEIEPANTRIPVMVIQPFVENAIIHGVGHLDRKGEISVEFDQVTANAITCVITDNGNGLNEDNRRSSGPENKKRGLGISITKNRIDLYNTSDNEEYGVRITNLRKTGKNMQGTRVTLHLPIID